MYKGTKEDNLLCFWQQHENVRMFLTLKRQLRKQNFAKELGRPDDKSVSRIEHSNYLRLAKVTEN